MYWVDQHLQDIYIYTHTHIVVVDLVLGLGLFSIYKLFLFSLPIFNREFMPIFVGAIGDNCGIQETGKDKTQRSSMIAGAQRVQIQWVD